MTHDLDPAALPASDVFLAHGPSTPNDCAPISLDAPAPGGANTALAQCCARQAQTIQELSALNQSLQEQLVHYHELQEQLQIAEAAIVRIEKMAALGERLAGVAHEINTPLGAMQASADNLTHTIGRSLQQIPELCRRLTPEQLQAFEQLLAWARQGIPPLSSRDERQLRRRILEQLNQLDPLHPSQLAEHQFHIASTLSQMGIDQPLAQLLPLLACEQVLFLLDAAYNLSTIQSNSRNIQTAIARTLPIVNSLRNYARHGKAIRPSMASIAEGIDTVLILYQNTLKHGIHVDRCYEDVPPLLCYREELDQVWSNLIGNALQAMAGQGKLEIAIRHEENGANNNRSNSIVVAISDSGPGIDDALKGKIFQTFFTTKPIGQGSGLGLSIAQKIVIRHGGTIELDSQPGRTTFRVYLPLHSPLVSTFEEPLSRSKQNA